MQIGEGVSKTKTCTEWIEVEFTVVPATPLPTAGPSPYDTYVLIDGNPEAVDLDKGGLHRVDDLCPASVEVGLRMPKFGIDETALDHEGDVDEDVKARPTNAKYSYEIHNEVPEVATFMSGEMLRNGVSAEARELKALFDRSARLQRSADAIRASAAGRSAIARQAQAAGLDAAAAAASIEAHAKFYALVAEGNAWDHKGRLTARWGSWHTWGAFEYFLDPWSNIHFGYVGRAAGFTTARLRLGASAAQTWEDLKDLDLSNAIRGDPGPDVVAIEKGAELFDKGTRPTPTVLIDVLDGTAGLTKRARSHNSYESKKSIVPK